MAQTLLSVLVRLGTAEEFTTIFARDERPCSNHNDRTSYHPPHGLRHRGHRPHEKLRFLRGGEGFLLRRQTRRGPRAGRAERRRQDHHAARAGGHSSADGRHHPHLRLRPSQRSRRRQAASRLHARRAAAVRLPHRRRASAVRGAAVPGRRRPRKDGSAPPRIRAGRQTQGAAERAVARHETEAHDRVRIHSRARTC